MIGTKNASVHDLLLHGIVPSKENLVSSAIGMKRGVGQGNEKTLLNDGMTRWQSDQDPNRSNRLPDQLYQMTKKYHTVPRIFWMVKMPPLLPLRQLGFWKPYHFSCHW